MSSKNKISPGSRQKNVAPFGRDSMVSAPAAASIKRAAS